MGYDRATRQIEQAVRAMAGIEPFTVDVLGDTFPHRRLCALCDESARHRLQNRMAESRDRIDCPTVQRLRYSQIRRRAYGLAEEAASAGNPPLSVRITDIDALALAARADTWQGRHRSGYGGFDWPHLWHRLVRHEHRSFHCALWHGSMLCGMAVGTVPRGHSHLTMRFLEGRPQGHPLQGHVAWIVLTAAEYYARGLSLPLIRLENPAPGLESWYRRLGFILALQGGAVRYLAMGLTRDQR